MSIFSFIETFFFLSLAISFVLILLLVYHFKQRISLLEQKNDTMITIINDIAKEMTMFRCNCACNQNNGDMNFSSMFGSSSKGGVCMIPSSFEIFQEQNLPNNLHEIIELNQDDDDEDDDDEDDEDDDDEDDDDEDDDDEEDILQKIVVSDNEETDTQEQDVDVVVSESEIYQEPVSQTVNKEENSYHKMSLSALKQLVVSKGLCTDASKMKKHELLQLIGT